MHSEERLFMRRVAMLVGVAGLGVVVLVICLLYFSIEVGVGFD